MADLSYKRALFDAIREAPDVADGMRRLLTFCRCQAPGNASLWSDLARRDFAAHSVVLRADFHKSLKHSPIPAKYTGMYFGLDGLNMRNGKGIEFGCSDTFVDSADDGGVQWAYDSSYYPFQIFSPLLWDLYDGVVEMASLADYAICIGYTGLAVRDALRQLPVSDTLGGAPARAVCWGPHDGGLYRLGTLRPEGLELNSKSPSEGRTNA